MICPFGLDQHMQGSARSDGSKDQSSHNTKRVRFVTFSRNCAASLKVMHSCFLQIGALSRTGRSTKEQQALAPQSIHPELGLTHQINSNSRNKLSYLQLRNSLISKLQSLPSTPDRTRELTSTGTTLDLLLPPLIRTSKPSISSSPKLVGSAQPGVWSSGKSSSSSRSMSVSSPPPSRSAVLVSSGPRRPASTSLKGK